LARLAIFIDGGYINSLAGDEFGIWVDYEKLPREIQNIVNSKTPESVDLLRTYFYDCLPYQGNPPTAEEASRFAQKRKFFDYLGRLPRFTVRDGILKFRGYDSAGKPIFQQKRVDLMLGLDFAQLSAKHQITHAAIIAGDSDFLPALAVAKEEGISVWLFHGPRRSRISGQATFATELWKIADERIEIDIAFMKAIEQPSGRRP
jgi:uncharacterized LabA/DUF88 family protein